MQAVGSRGPRLLFLALGLVVQAACGDAVDELQATIAAVAERVKPAVVRVVAERALPAELLDVPRPAAPDGGLPSSRGSGMIFRETDDAYFVLTNAHVVADSPTRAVRIKLLPERETRSGEVVGLDLRTDTAVVRMPRREGERLPLVTFGRSDDLRVGSLVLAVGSPFDFEATVTLGVVSSLGRQLDAPDEARVDARFRETYRGLIQTDASINPGNSGGPLVNLRGEVVGVNFAIYAGGLDRGNIGIGFAQPIDRALSVIEDLIQHGHPVRGYLGIGIADLDEAGARLELPLREFRELLGTDVGAYVSEVTPNSPAEAAGIEPGDVIVAVDGDAVESVGQLQDHIGTLKPGGRSVVELLRAARRLRVEVSLAEMPVGARPDLAAAEPPAEAPEQEGNALGVTVAELPAEALQALGIEAGVIVTAAVAGGPGERAGLLPETVILAGRQVGDEKVEFGTPEEFEEFVADVGAVGGAVQLWVIVRGQGAPPRLLSILAEVPGVAAG